MKKIDENDLLVVERFKAIRASEIKEAREWIDKGKVGAVWHWKSEKEQESSLDGSFDFFQSQTDQRTEEAIIHFVGQEVYDLWNGYKDDSLTNRCNHARALYDYIKNRLSL